MKKHTPKSTHDYIHVNKNNITIGQKGKTKTVLPRSDILQKIESVQRMSVKKSIQYKHNSKFPSNLGTNGEITAIIKKEYNAFKDLFYNKSTNDYTPEEVLAYYNTLSTKTTARGFNTALRPFVREYYGISHDTSDKQLDKMLKKGDLISPIADIGLYEDSPIGYAARIQEWTLDNLNVPPEISKNFNKVNDPTIYARISQNYKEKNKNIDFKEAAGELLKLFK